MDLEARREARRRKILENSGSRLRRITGVEEKSTKSEIDFFRHPQDEENADSYLVNHQVNFTHSDCTNSTSINTHSENACYSEAMAISKTTMTRHDDCKGYPRFYYVVMIPLIFNLLLIICRILLFDIEYLHLNKIFLPLIAFEIIYFYLGSNDSESSTAISTILTFTNLGKVLKNSYVRSGQKCICSILRMTQDMMIYFFIFIVFHTLLNVCT